MIKKKKILQPLRISIIGCGWLGSAIKTTLSTQNDIRCYTRHLEQATLKGYFYKPDQNSPFWECDYLIIAISTKDHYLETLEHIGLHVSTNSIVLFMSSISVYRESDTVVDEAYPIQSLSQQYEAELLIKQLHSKTVILRLGGLMGYDRVAGRWSKATVYTDGAVNYIHRDDVIGVVRTIMRQQIDFGVFNIVAPLHPLRSDVHRHKAQKFSFALGDFYGMTHRIVLSNKLLKHLQYVFIYPDPLKFWN